jgi:hypothetical protein
MAKVRPLPRNRVKYQHRSQFGLIVVCRDERDQRQGYARLRRLGLKVRVVTV